MSDDLLIFSLGLWSLRDELAVLTGLTPRLAPLGRKDCRAVAGWGHKLTARRARRFAAKIGKPYIAFEDGFLRSIRPGPATKPLSLVMDWSGIYYDAREPSDLEGMLASGEFTPQEIDTGNELMAALRRHRLSKYNDARLSSRMPLFTGKASTRVLVIDQTYGDASIQGGLANAGTFTEMLAAARAENPDADLAVKLHPETLSGGKRGYLRQEAERLSMHIIDHPVNPWSLIDEADHVYTVSSQLGLEALIAGRKVSVFGVPFYAGWGLTDDRQSAPRRQRERSLGEVFTAAYVRYARYFDPWTRRAIDPLTALDQLCFLRDQFTRNDTMTVGYKVARWKKHPIAALLDGPGGQPVFVDTAGEAIKIAKTGRARVAAWGRIANRDAERLRAEGIPFTSIEDGFIRSAGLGAAFTPSVSFTLDDTGIYYDPSRPSDLESLLRSIELTPDLGRRAQNLRKQIIELGLTKYNLAQTDRIPEIPGDREIILVPGQVLDDEAIRLAVPSEYLAENPLEGGANLHLLRQARRMNPAAYIIYKPHPDVERLGRLGKIPRQVVSQFADIVAANLPIVALLGVAQRVETLTSLTGFEAILRGIPVRVHGQPFYAGWGLSEDLDPPRRRGRKLTLDELVAGALILYPRYYDPVSRLPCPVEIAIERIAAQRLRPRSLRDDVRELAGRLVIATRKFGR
jgi:capsular polysaccharide export protein